MTRKPNLKDKIFGCVAFTKDMIVGIFTFDVPRIQLDWYLICETIKGNYEIVEKGKYHERICKKTKRKGRCI